MPVGRMISIPKKTKYVNIDLNSCLFNRFGTYFAIGTLVNKFNINSKP